MIPVFERAKSFHTLDRVVTVIGNVQYKEKKILYFHVS
jgi:hypothetical protein